jgi:hypothetical protein
MLHHVTNTPMGSGTLKKRSLLELIVWVENAATSQKNMGVLATRGGNFSADTDREVPFSTAIVASLLT